MAGVDTISGNIDGLGALIDSLASAVRELAAAFKAAPPKPAGGAGQSAAGPGGGGAGPKGGGLKGALAAVSGFAGGVMAAVSKLGEFVRVLNPAQMELFDRAVGSLQATIGQALAPVFSVLTDVITEAADIIAPVFEQLAGVLGDFASSAVGYLLPVIRLVADVLEAIVEIATPLVEIMSELLNVVGVVVELVRGVLPLLVSLVKALVYVLKPVLDVLVGIVKVLAAFLQLVFAIVNAISAVVSAFLGQAAALSDLGIKGFFDGLVKGIQDMTRAVISFTARLFRLFGMDKAFEALKKMYDPRREGVGKRRLPAPSDFGFASLDQIVREGTAAAAKATGAGAPQTTEDFLDKISEDLAKIAKEKPGETMASMAGYVKELRDYFIGIRDAPRTGGNSLVGYRPSDYLVWLTTGADPYERYRKSKGEG